MQRGIVEARTAVVQAARRMSRLGLVVSVWGNVSARVPGTKLAVVTPSGVEYDVLAEDMLCLFDVSTEALLEGPLRPSSETPMHLTVYRAREDVGGIVHTHSLHATAFSVVRQSIPPIVEDLAQVVGGSVECAEYARAGSQALADNVVRALGPRTAALMANHGVVGVGPTPAEALRVCHVVEKCAWIYSVARCLAPPVVLSALDVAALRHTYVTSYGQRGTAKAIS